MNYKKIIDLFKKEKQYRLLSKGFWGLEKESVRITPEGNLALTEHPAIFGDKLENPSITVDFSESQIEMVTSPENSIEKTYRALFEIQDSVLKNLKKNEFLWPFSMPPRLPEDSMIPIARFNNTEMGKKNEMYRQGLAIRYGKKMQMISGIHYNFSFQNEFWDFLNKNLDVRIERQSFINDSYFSLARNYLRFRWLVIYLFGASPVADETFSKDDFEKIDRLKNSAVSIRMSPFGYSSQRQKGVSVSYDCLDAYIGDLEKALRTESETFKEKQPQLNSHVLQKDSEFYSPIRFKSDAKKGESHLEKLKTKGVSYIEIRSVDLNPFDKAGVHLEQLYFYHLLLLYCLFEESDLISEKEMKNIQENDRVSALFGREKNISLVKGDNSKINLKEWAGEILKKMEELAELLDKELPSSKYSESLSSQKMKLENNELLPSQKIRTEMQRNQEKFIEFGLRKANDLKKKERSVELMKGYQDLELSTQILIKEALNRNILVEVLDPSDNFIRLKKAGKVEYIKQATRTSADHYIAPLIMENKHVTKKVLEEKGIKTPRGSLYTDIGEALRDYRLYQNTGLVVKPNKTNFGIGITILKKGYSLREYTEALKAAFNEDSTVIMEEYIPGKEYRFLVIGGRVVGILHRVPANVTGDGIRNIRQLVNLKNKDPLRGKGYKTPLEKISLGKVEKEFLGQQGKDIYSIPQKNEMVFLRKNSNISTGGDSIDFTDEVLNEYKEIAVKAAGAAGAQICGADIIISDIQSFPNPENYALIELNFNPALHIHSFPFQGKNRYPEKAVLDLLRF